eukprot:1211856-Pyramimonas_sp.AAC.1
MRGAPKWARGRHVDIPTWANGRAPGWSTKRVRDKPKWAPGRHVNAPTGAGHRWRSPCGRETSE